MRQKIKKLLQKTFTKNNFLLYNSVYKHYGNGGKTMYKALDVAKALLYYAKGKKKCFTMHKVSHMR